MRMLWSRDRTCQSEALNDLKTCFCLRGHSARAYRKRQPAPARGRNALQQARRARTGHKELKGLGLRVGADRDTGLGLYGHANVNNTVLSCDLRDPLPLGRRKTRSHTFVL